jgi:glutathionyl-hydroquinone reductase
MVQLLDPSRTVVATAQVIEQDRKYSGRIDLSLMPVVLQQKFREYEEIVNEQMFSLLDEIEEQISALRLKIRFATGYEVAIEDLQIYPTTKRISFLKVKEPVLMAPKELMPV